MKHKKRMHNINDPTTTSSGTQELGKATPEAVVVPEGVQPEKYEELKGQIRSAQNDATEAKSMYMRMAADFENYRKRVDRERREYLSFGLQQAAEALFPALDDLDRAQAVLNDQMSPKDLLESIKLIFNRIRQAVEQIGLKPIKALGEHFDPQLHEPVQKVETTEFPDGAVMEVLRNGYTLNGKVVRPALVNVASGKTFDEQDEQDEPAESKT